MLGSWWHVFSTESFILTPPNIFLVMGSNDSTFVSNHTYVSFSPEGILTSSRSSNQLSFLGGQKFGSEYWNLDRTGCSSQTMMQKHKKRDFWIILALWNDPNLSMNKNVETVLKTQDLCQETHQFKLTLPLLIRRVVKYLARMMLE